MDGVNIFNVQGRFESVDLFAGNIKDPSELGTPEWFSSKEFTLRASSAGTPCAESSDGCLLLSL